jgi:hypothetical protein
MCRRKLKGRPEYELFGYFAERYKAYCRAIDHQVMMLELQEVFELEAERELKVTLQQWEQALI